MGARTIVETRSDRQALVADAGLRQLSIPSAVAGALAAYGAFALLAGLAAGVLGRANSTVEVASPWGQIGVAGGIVVAGLLLVAYLAGGYVAGRMARRRGALHGLVVFVVGGILAVGFAFVGRRLGGSSVAVDNLRGLGLPTTASEWGDIATVAGVASLAAMLVGALAGGVLGERWHAKLLSRALDPQVGAEAEARRQSQLRAAEAEERRVSAYRRVRTTTPARTRRVDREAELPVVERRATPSPASPPSRALPAAPATDRSAVPSGGRTG